MPIVRLSARWRPHRLTTPSDPNLPSRDGWGQCFVGAVRHHHGRDCVDEAFGAFFARAAVGTTGKAVGYPRFKGHGRWDTVGYDETTGWKLNLDGTRKDPRPHLYVPGVGNLPLSKRAARQLRRYATRGGVPTTLTLTWSNRDGSAWRASVGFKNLAVERMAEPALGPDSVAGVDRGIAVLVAAASADGYDVDPVNCSTTPPSSRPSWTSSAPRSKSCSGSARARRSTDGAGARSPGASSARTRRPHASPRTGPGTPRSSSSSSTPSSWSRSSTSRT